MLLLNSVLLLTRTYLYICRSLAHRQKKALGVPALLYFHTSSPLRHKLQRRQNGPLTNQQIWFISLSNDDKTWYYWSSLEWPSKYCWWGLYNRVEAEIDCYCSAGFAISNLSVHRKISENLGVYWPLKPDSWGCCNVFSVTLVTVIWQRWSLLPKHLFLFSQLINQW